MNGLTGTRRLARPVRLVLARKLGSDIDGAWWPHTGSVAGELPELIETLHKTLGEIIDIRVNWAATEGTLDFNSILSSTRTKNSGPRRPHRLMAVAGRSASVKLLVIPHMTTPALGAMVMRCAVGKANTGSPDCEQWSEAAGTVIRDARSDSVAWMAQS
ncbi:hypothetical protein AU197_16755 [Mycobacterium sp. IS-1590]|uniref:DUF5994 family protein n=1 Tax=Mycobacterium sp. IS-1590 TaxID=1772286 RepID=UPI0007490463|nr:DUF5994 family protein [Mycobacterium sp. IS-1590]KUI41486.1 hypothetical protein AU197_16755 [Mycobacterium sp. IS-1590]